MRGAIAAVFVPAGLSVASLFLLAGEADLAGVEGGAAAAAAALVVDDDLRVSESAEATQGKSAVSMQRDMGEDGCGVRVVMALGCCKGMGEDGCGKGSNGIRLPVAQCMRGAAWLSHALPPAW